MTWWTISMYSNRLRLFLYITLESVYWGCLLVSMLFCMLLVLGSMNPQLETTQTFSYQEMADVIYTIILNSSKLLTERRRYWRRHVSIKDRGDLWLVDGRIGCNMDGWMFGWVDGFLYWILYILHIPTVEAQCTYTQKDRWMDGRIDNWTDLLMYQSSFWFAMNTTLNNCCRLQLSSVPIFLTRFLRWLVDGRMLACMKGWIIR